MNHHPLRSLPLAGLSSLLFVCVCAADITVVEGRSRAYTGRAELSPGNPCVFSIEIEKTQFLLLAMAGKYRFVRLQIDCTGEQDLALSSSEDRLQMLLAGAEIPGVLSLQRADSALWDALDADMRRTLAYPRTVAAGQPVYVFAYFPLAPVADLPEHFSYTIASLERTVTLGFRATAARN